MQEYRCGRCGYRKWQKESIDGMLEISTFGSFGMNNMMSMTNFSESIEDYCCPNCRKASEWGPINK